MFTNKDFNMQLVMTECQPDNIGKARQQRH